MDNVAFGDLLLSDSQTTLLAHVAAAVAPRPFTEHTSGPVELVFGLAQRCNMKKDIPQCLTQGVVWKCAPLWLLLLLWHLWSEVRHDAVLFRRNAHSCHRVFKDS